MNRSDEFAADSCKVRQAPRQGRKSNNVHRGEHQDAHTEEGQSSLRMRMRHLQLQMFTDAATRQR